MTRKIKIIGITICWALWALVLHLVNQYTQPNAITFSLFAGASAGFLVLICLLFFNRKTP